MKKLIVKLIEELTVSLEKAKKELALIESQENSNSIEEDSILIAGLKFAKENLGTDSNNPYGKYYTFNEAQKECPKGWRCPTSKEWEHFIKNTTSKWTTQNGITGRLITDKKTKNKLFFPASGFRNYSDGSFYLVTALGYYWSSSVYNTAYGYNLRFDQSNGVVPQYSLNRSYGFSVRCIKE